MNILQILQHMMKLSANLIKFIFTQAMKYSLVINWQLEGKILEYLLTSLRNSAKDCNFKAVNAETYCKESIRDTFISGLSSNLIRQRLLEDQSLTLKTA